MNRLQTAMVSSFRSVGFALCAMLLVTGCGSKKQPQARVPAPPSVEASSPKPRPASRRVDTAQGVDTRVDADAYRNVKPIYVETGVASWYGPPYHNRKTANGEVFDMNIPSAAHKTLPLNSLVRVTALANGKSAILRITDRGPFIGDRVLDLSLGAAKDLGVWRMGLAKVKIEVLEAPKPLDSGGRWCVQIGAFADTDGATKLKEKLMRKYKSAKVIQFAGPTGDWVRIRPLQDDRSRSYEIARDTRVNEGGVFLVRLD
ncbi:MAG TPA: septal ring lytic transglycosylase RlpA family protein [Terriglobales bacterium]|nr:septal ring lytic transglycosylase RlpA family protein [Terriglobales bacterium]